MSDDFLYGMRREPTPRFAAQLRSRLARQGSAPPATLRHGSGQATGWRAPRGVDGPVRRVAAIVGSAVIAALLFAFPGVRASAQAFLNLFRVVNFVAVPVDLGRLDRLAQHDLSLDRLIGEHVEFLVPASPAQPYLTPALAGTAAGVKLQMPATLPAGLEMTSVRVMSGHTVRVTADTNKLQRVLESLDLQDVAVPDGLHGQTVTIQVPPVVDVQYRQRAGYTSEQYRSEVGFVQARTPEVALPEGLELSRLAEIGMRIMGLTEDEAHRFAEAIDWHTTLLVPVPANAASFRQVDVAGHRGLVIETAPQRKPQGGTERLSIVVWSDGAQVFGLKGSLRPITLLEMANSVH